MDPRRADRFSKSVSGFVRRAACALGGGLLVMGATGAGSAQASEGGASFYLLGSGGPEAAVLPPVPGVFFGNTAYYYEGGAGPGREFTIGGNVVAGVHATIGADFPAVMWVPTTNLGGTTLAFTFLAPFGEPSVDVQAVLAGPLGRQFGITRSDSHFVFGDPIVGASLGWKAAPKTTVQVSSLLNIPVGDYRAGELANLAFHRWIDDLSLAVTWHDPATGWDISGKGGFTFNGTNDYDDYTTGTESHWEASIEKAITPAFSAGFQAYFFDQISGDSGTGARLGAFEGRVVGVGGQAAYNVKVANVPMTLRLHGTTEFDAKNRLEGHTIWLDFSMPLHVVMPSAPPH